MRILFYAAKTFDKESFNAIIDRYPDIDIDYTSHELGPRSATMANGYDAICAFVNANIGAKTLNVLAKNNVA